MALLRVGELPEGVLAAAAEFHARVLPQICPPPKGEGDHREAMVEGHPPHGATRHSSKPMVPLHHPADGYPPRNGEDHLVLVFHPADHTHRAWRLAAVQGLAREHAPIRVNAVASDDEAAIAAALDYLAHAPGVTGQYWPLDAEGAGSA